MCPLSKVMATTPWRCGVWSIIDTNSGGISQPGGLGVCQSIELSPPTSTQRGLHLTLMESSRDSCSYLMNSPGVHGQVVAHPCWLQERQEGTPRANPKLLVGEHLFTVEFFANTH